MNDYISKSSVCEILADIYPTDGEMVVPVKEIDKAYEEILQLPSAQPEDCDTCKHGYFGDSHCDNCRVRYPSHYERRTE